jgi:hypothetical protein
VPFNQTMKLPEIQTRKKIRDGKICSMFINGSTREEISDKFKLSVRQIERILYKNSTVIKEALELTKDQEKVNRIMFLRKQIKLSKRYNVDLDLSPLTLNEELKKELEGNKLEYGSGETKIIIIRSGVESPKEITINRIPVCQN